MIVHEMSALIRLVWILLPAAYQLLPNITRGSIWFGPAREEALPAPPPALDITHSGLDYVLCDVIMC